MSSSTVCRAVVLTLGLTGLAVIDASGALAKAPRKKKLKQVSSAPAEAPPPTAVAVPVAPQPVTGAARPDPYAGESTQSLLAKATSLYNGMDYDEVIPLAEAVLARADITIDQRLDAYLLHGSSLAVVGDAVEAEKPFRFLLRGRPDFEMPADTSPKILAVFRKVQVEEKTIVDQMKELARQRAIREIELKSEVPREGKGGLPLVFEFKLKDPRGAVAAMDLHYRKAAGDPYSALALKVDDAGFWKAELPGEWTENEDGFTLEYYLRTKDATATDLIMVGGPTAPATVTIAAGSMAEARPFYESWWFWTATAGAVIAAGVSGWLIYEQATKLPETDERTHFGEQ